MNTHYALPILLLGISAAAQSQTQFTISTIAGTGTDGRSGDGGPATSAEFNNPLGLAVDSAGNLYVADFYNNRIRRVAVDGTITTVAGIGTYGSSGDGGLATQAELGNPESLAFDAAGNLYVGGYDNRVREIALDGTITTIAGNGNRGLDGDGGSAAAASLDFPSSLAIDSAGNLYIAGSDDHTCVLSAIRKVTLDGIITTIAGNGTPGFSGDGGPAALALVNCPTGLSLDSDGNLLFSDGGNYRIRKIANGIITTVAGTGVAGYAGDDGPAIEAEINSATQTAFDAAGNLYIADRENERIRVLLNDGIITTVAGNGDAAVAGDGSAALGAMLDNPWGLAISASGALYVSGATTDPQIRLLTPISPSVAAVNAASYATAPVATNAIASAFGADLANQIASASGALSASLGGTSAQVTDVTGITAPAQLFYVSPSQVNLLVPSTLAIGLGTLQIKSGDGTVSTSPLQIASVVPGLFNENGLALGSVIQVSASGDQTAQSLVQYDSATGQYAPVPIALDSGSATYLILYGTGLRNASLSQVSVSIGGATVAPAFAGAQPTFEGLDQVNLEIPISLAGAGDVAITLTASGVASNAVNVTIQ